MDSSVLQNTLSGTSAPTKYQKEQSDGTACHDGSSGLDASDRSRAVDTNRHEVVPEDIISKQVADKFRMQEEILQNMHLYPTHMMSQSAFLPSVQTSIATEACASTRGCDLVASSQSTDTSKFEKKISREIAPRVGAGTILSLKLPFVPSPNVQLALSH